MRSVILLVILITILIIPCANAQWLAKQDAFRKRSEVTSIVYNEKLYTFLGFSNSALEVESSVEVYDPATNRWTLLDSLPATKSVTHQGVALIDDNVWHIGGRIGKNPGALSSSIWIYNITNNTWSSGPAILNPSSGQPLYWAAGGAVLLGRTLHIFGGFVNTACNSDQASYHLTLDVDGWLSDRTKPALWKNNLAPMPLPRNHFGTTVLAGKMYAIGGQFGHDCDGGLDQVFCHVYNPDKNTWTELPGLPSPRSHIEGGTFATDGKIYVVAGQGQGGVSTNKVTIFDPSANNGIGAWRDGGLNLPKSYEGVSAKIINSSMFYSHGGEGASSFTRNQTYGRDITRNIEYKLGFPASCASVTREAGTSTKINTLLFTSEGSKNYALYSNAGWLTVTKNATGTAVLNGADIELTINTDNLQPGNYNAIVRAVGTGSGPAYSEAGYCVNVNVYKYTSVIKTTIILPIADAFVRNNSYASINYGSDTGLVVKAGVSPGFSRTSYLKFSIKDVSNIATAKLKIFGRNTENSTSVITTVFPVSNDSWTETGITWNNAPAASASPVANLSVNNQGKYYEADVTDYLIQEVSSDQLVSFQLKDSNQQNKNVSFNSKENKANPPQLIITYYDNDTTRPAPNILLGGNNIGSNQFQDSVRIIITANDEGGSGLASLMYSINGASYQVYDSSFVITTPGNYSITAKATDKNQNVSETTEIFFTLSSSIPSSVTITAIEDAYVRNGSYATGNYGSAAKLVVKNSPSAGLNRNTYLKFSLSDLKNITNARLRLYGYNTENTSTITLSIFGVNDSWTENTITWNNAPLQTAQAINSVGISNSKKYYEIDLTPYIQSEFNGDKMASLLISDVKKQNRNIEFNSHENISNKPELLITQYKSQASLLRNSEQVSQQAYNIDLADKSITIYPNPSNSKFNIYLPVNSTAISNLSVMDKSGRSYNINGSQILKFNNSAQVDVSNYFLKPGIYFVLVTMANGKVHTSKLILL